MHHRGQRGDAVEQGGDGVPVGDVTADDLDVAPSAVSSSTSSVAPGAASPRREVSTRSRTPCPATRCRATSAPSPPVPPVTSTVPGSGRGRAPRRRPDPEDARQPRHASTARPAGPLRLTGAGHRRRGASGRPASRVDRHPPARTGPGSPPARPGPGPTTGAWARSAPPPSTHRPRVITTSRARRPAPGRPARTWSSGEGRRQRPPGGGGRSASIVGRGERASTTSGRRADPLRVAPRPVAVPVGAAVVQSTAPDGRRRSGPRPASWRRRPDGPSARAPTTATGAPAGVGEVQGGGLPARWR